MEVDAKIQHRTRRKILISTQVCDDCHSVLEGDPEDLKALFRGGKALVGIKDYDGARSLFHRCLDVDADCKDAEKMLRHERPPNPKAYGFKRAKDSEP